MEKNLTQIPKHINCFNSDQRRQCFSYFMKFIYDHWIFFSSTRQGCHSSISHHFYCKTASRNTNKKHWRSSMDPWSPQNKSLLCGKSQCYHTISSFKRRRESLYMGTFNYSSWHLKREFKGDRLAYAALPPSLPHYSLEPLSVQWKFPKAPLQMWFGYFSFYYTSGLLLPELFNYLPDNQQVGCYQCMSVMKDPIYAPR